MSTKFSGIPSTQKPPAVCKKQPPPDTIPLPPFLDRIFQGYCQWKDTYLYPNINISGYTTITPGPAPNDWAGIITAPPYQIAIVMTRHGKSNFFTYSVELLQNGVSISSYNRHSVPAQHLEPFDSGLISFANGAYNQTIQLRILL